MVPQRLSRLEQRRLPAGVRLFVARGPRARLLGLAGLRELPQGCALLLPRCRSVHTLGMRFAIDVVFLERRSGFPLGLRRGVRPGRFVGRRDAGAVVECAAGEGDRVARALARVK